MIELSHSSERARGREEAKGNTMAIKNVFAEIDELKKDIGVDTDSKLSVCKSFPATSARKQVGVGP